MGAISASLGQMLSNNQQVNANTTPLQIFFHSIWSNQLIGLVRCQLYFPQTLDLANALGGKLHIFACQGTARSVFKVLMSRDAQR